MINIPEEVISLLKNDSTRKNFRVHFPRGERADIINDNVVSESVILTESICSKEKLTFGLCESPYIEFETYGIENIKGCTIECSIELICSADIEGAEYKTDLQAYVYSIPLGTFIVKSCKKQADMTHRKIQAYSNINLSVSNVADFLAYLQPYSIDINGLMAIAFDDETILGDYTSTPTIWQSLSIEDACPFVAYSNEIDIQKPDDETPFQYIFKSTGGNLTQKDLYYRFTYSIGTSKSYASPTPSGFIICKYDNQTLKYDEVCKEAYNYIKNTFVKDNKIKYAKASQTYASTSTLDLSQNRGFFSFFSQEKKLGITPLHHMVYGQSFRYDNVKTFEKLEQKIVLKNHDSTNFGLKIADDDGNLLNSSFGSFSTILSYVENKENYTHAKEETERILSENKYLYDVSIPHQFDTEDGRYLIQYEESAIRLKADEAEANFQSITEGWLELQGKFGSVERDGSFALFDAKDSFVEHNGTLTADDYSSLWYDDDESLPIGRLICTWKDSNGKEHFSEKKIADDYDTSTHRTYSITNNWFIQNYPYTSTKISAIFDEMSESITSDIKYMPMELTIKGRPDIEVGDVFDVETPDGTITGFIERRTLSGIQHLTDAIVSEDEEHATSNSSIKSSYDEETGTLTIYT